MAVRPVDLAHARHVLAQAFELSRVLARAPDDATPAQLESLAYQCTTTAKQMTSLAARLRRDARKKAKSTGAAGAAVIE